MAMSIRFEGNMKKRLQAIAIVVSVPFAIFVFLIGYGVVMGYNFIYVRVPWATFSVNGRSSSEFSLYQEIRRESLVISSGPLWNREMYVVENVKPRPDQDHPVRNYVFPCASSAFATLPGMLIHNHEQMCAPVVVLEPSTAPPQKRRDRELKIGNRNFEFLANDGRRIGAKW